MIEIQPRAVQVSLTTAVFNHCHPSACATNHVGTAALGCPAERSSAQPEPQNRIPITELLFSAISAAQFFSARTLGS